MRVAVIGAGWAGLAAAVRARQAGHEVTLVEMAAVAGGRARSDEVSAGDGEAPRPVDNGQHMLLGGYTRTLDLMRGVGVDVDDALLRLPLGLRYPDGAGFEWRAAGPAGQAVSALAALLRARGFTLADRLSALRLAWDWRRRGFECAPELTVEELLRPHATPRLRALLLDPLCVSALNTPPAQASASVWLAVMRDSLFGAPGAADLWLPRRPLHDLLPGPALSWLARHCVDLRLRSRALRLARGDGRWRLQLHPPPDESGQAPGLAADAVILAASATESARLAEPWNPSWATQARALPFEAIVTLGLRMPRRVDPPAVLALRHDERRPAQFAFHGGALDADSERLVLVVSAASRWLARGSAAVIAAAQAQCAEAFSLAPDSMPECLEWRADRRATFRCDAGLVRPGLHVAEGLYAAGDYLDGPYPATLEAAVRAGEAAARAL